MARGLGSGVLTCVDAAHVKWFPLIELGLDAGTLYIAGLAHDVDYSGHTYQAALGKGTIEPIEETDAGVMGLAFTLSAVPSSSLSMALGTEVQGRSCKLMMAFIDSSNVLQVDTNTWVGYLDQMPISDGDGAQPNTSLLRVTAEHKLVRWDTPRVFRFSDEDQKAINATDGFFKWSAAIAQAVLVWPHKEFFKQQ